jgi:xanthine dehydrogenase accessory factor
VNEGLFARLDAWLARGPVVLASVMETRGATPRKGGSRMLVARRRCFGSVGGGLAEARVIEAAHDLLDRRGHRADVEIDLSGRPGAAGICGGHMRVCLRRWQGSVDRARAADIHRRLAAGEQVTLGAPELGCVAGEEQRATPDIRLLIIGAGHCGLALHDLALQLDFELWVYDEREDVLPAFKSARQLTGDATQLLRALDTPRTVFAVCLTRDFHADLAALRVLSQRPPAFIAMMGSQRRIAQVRAALAEQAGALAHLQAPVGIDIDAQTPHEIAISILAQLIQRRRQLEPCSA